MSAPLGPTAVAASLPFIRRARRGRRSLVVMLGPKTQTKTKTKT